MLDDDEFANVMALIGSGTKGDLWERRFGPVLREYERITGLYETNPDAVFHHQLSMYGLPCKKCGKPLRSLTAKMCGACMAPVSGAQ